METEPLPKGGHLRPAADVILALQRVRSAQLLLGRSLDQWHMPEPVSTPFGAPST